jgi:hypothetical protein
MHRPMPERTIWTWRSSARSGTLSIVIWAFGFATTLLLVGLWGRAVTHDTSTVQEAARSAVDAEIAGDRIYSWIEEGVASSADIDPATTEQVIAGLSNHPEVKKAVAGVVDEFIAALFTAEGGSMSLELTENLAPVIPLVASQLAASEVPVDEAALNAALEDVEEIGLATGDVATAARIIDDARSLLSLVVVLAGVTLMTTGMLAVWLSENRLAMTRSLATRLAFSALSFAALFRVGSWALDPDGGGSPIAKSGSVLLGSNASVFLVVAAGAAAVSVGMGWSLWRRRVGVDRDARGPNSDADTMELVKV